MKVIDKCDVMQSISDSLRSEGKTIGFVPTMGFFHDGHLSLMHESLSECKITIVSLFVNPTQFAPNEDLAKYPRDFERDRKLAEGTGVDYLFYPDASEIYTKDHLTFVEVTGLSNILCGVSRPTHFKGVTTICAKLFNIVKPHRVYFGQKDAQQAIIIKRMIEELNFDIKMRVMPIYRESDGLAMSSRNKYLNPDERNRAVALHQTLLVVQKEFDSGIKDVDKLKKSGLDSIKSMINQKQDKIVYMEIQDAEDLSEIRVIEKPALVAIAAYVGKTRLIDNIILHPEKKIR
jgi:pantoate--beta-alanine ligase